MNSDSRATRAVTAKSTVAKRFQQIIQQNEMKGHDNFPNHSYSKGDILSVHIMKAYMRSKGTASLILDHSR